MRAARSGFEPEKLRLRDRRQAGALLGERLDARARTRIATEVKIEVGEIEHRLLHRRSPSRAAAHVDGRLEMRERLREVPLAVRERGQFSRMVATDPASPAASAACSADS